MPKGHVYIIVNSRARERVKVGRTNDLRRRLAQHNRASNSIGRWSYHAHWEVTDDRAAERDALAALSHRRIPGKRELFEARPRWARRRIHRALRPWRTVADRRRKALATTAKLAVAAAALLAAGALGRDPTLAYGAAAWLRGLVGL